MRDRHRTTLLLTEIRERPRRDPRRRSGGSRTSRSICWDVKDCPPRTPELCARERLYRARRPVPTVAAIERELARRSVYRSTGQVSFQRPGFRGWVPSRGGTPPSIPQRRRYPAICSRVPSRRSVCRSSRRALSRDRACSRRRLPLQGRSRSPGSARLVVSGLRVATVRRFVHVLDEALRHSDLTIGQDVDPLSFAGVGLHIAGLVCPSAVALRTTSAS